MPKYVDDDGNMHPFVTRSHVLESLQADELEALKQQKRKSKMKLRQKLKKKPVKMVDRGVGSFIYDEYLDQKNNTVLVIDNQEK